MTTEPRKSSVLTDNDYRLAKTWTFNQASIARNIKNQGGIYEGLLEAVQNGIDSPLDPDNDYNRIDITVPLLGDKDYGVLVASVRDLGGSVTKDYGGSITKFINSEKAISPKSRKGIHRFGEGMIRFPSVSATQLIISQDKEYIYRIPILLDRDGIPAYGDWSFHKITPETQAEFNIFHMGTLVSFFDPYENMIDIDTMKLGKTIRQTFGWRLLLQPKTEIWINNIIKVDLPEYLRGRKPAFMCRLKRTKVTDSNGEQRVVDPEVTGFVFYDKDGRGVLHVHAGGYYIGEVKYADKRFSGAINIDEMPTDTSRRVMIHESMKQDLEQHILEITKHFPDIPTGKEELGEKRHKSLTEIINKILDQFNIPKLQIENYEAEKRKRIEILGDPNADERPGYRKPNPNPTPTVLKICDLCGHLNKKSRKMRKKCSCECHIPRDRKPNEHVSTVGENGNIPVLVEEEDITKIKKHSQLDVKPTEGKPYERFIEIRTGYVSINTKNPLFIPLVLKEKNMNKAVKNIIYFLAGEMMDLKHPNALTEMTLAEFRKTEEDYVMKMIDVIV